jgi:hypothetical protein
MTKFSGAAHRRSGQQVARLIISLATVPDGAARRRVSGALATYRSEWITADHPFVRL